MTEDKFDNTHQEVWTLLPWYLTQTLSSDEDAVVEAHLTMCHLCREELAQQKVVKQAVNVNNAADTEAAADIENDVNTAINRTLATLHKRIKAEADSTNTANKTQSWLQQLIQIFKESHAGLQTALVAQTAVIALAVVFIFAPSPQPQNFQTLTSPNEQATQQHARLNVIFAEDLTLIDLQKLLEAHQLSITSGPSPAGTYQLTVKTTDQPGTKKPGESVTEEIVASLQSHPQVLFAHAIQ